MEIYINTHKVLIDDEDWPLVSAKRWRIITNRSGVSYAISLGKNRVAMHRLITNAEKGVCIDHKDGDGLNNKKVNLRKCLHSENMRNRKMHKNNKSGFKGVYFNRRKNAGTKPWRARITVDKKVISLGIYRSSIEAAIAYDKAAIKFHGEFARLNFDKSANYTDR